MSQLKSVERIAYLYQDTKSGIYHVQKRIHGSPKKKSLGTRNLRDARKLIPAAIAEMQNQNPDRINDKQILIRDVFQDLRDNKVAHGIKNSTLKRMDNVWEYSIAPFWGDLYPEDLNQDNADRFLVWHMKHRPCVQFVNVYKYLRNICNFLRKKGYAVVTPDFMMPKDEERHHRTNKGRIITEDEVRAILAAANETLHLAVMVAYVTGMRKMEILGLERDRIKFESDGTVVFRLSEYDTKTSLARDIPIIGRLAVMVQERMSDGRQFLFPMKSDPARNISGQVLDTMWIRAKANAKIKGTMKFHSLRHTAATNMARRGVNPIVATTLLGMTLKEYQKTYLNLTAKDLIIAVKDAAASLDPKGL